MNRLKEARKEANMTRREVSIKVDVTEQTLCTWEGLEDLSPLKYSSLLKLSKALKKPVNFFVKFDN